MLFPKPELIGSKIKRPKLDDGETDQGEAEVPETPRESVDLSEKVIGEYDDDPPEAIGIRFTKKGSKVGEH